MGGHEKNTSAPHSSIGPVFSSRSVFEEILDDWIGRLDEQLMAPSALGSNPDERVSIEAARSAYEGLRDRATW